MSSPDLQLRRANHIVSFDSREVRDKWMEVLTQAWTSRSREYTYSLTIPSYLQMSMNDESMPNVRDGEGRKGKVKPDVRGR